MSWLSEGEVPNRVASPGLVASHSATTSLVSGVCPRLSNALAERLAVFHLRTRPPLSRVSASALVNSSPLERYYYFTGAFTTRAFIFLVSRTARRCCRR